MRIGVVTNNLNSNDGWGKYSLGFLKELRKHGEIDVVCNQPEKIEGINFYPIMPPVFSHPLVTLLYIPKLKAIFKGCDIIHCLVEPFALVTAITSILLKKPYILTVMGTYAVRPLVKGGLRGLLLKFAYKKAYKLVAISTFTKNKILEYYKLDNIEVIPPGIDFEAFQRR